MKIIHSKIVPLPRTDIDTDLIIPADFLKITDKKGLGSHVFERLRAADADFPFNLAKYRDAQILVTGRNFGCGSSREHAPWALYDWGIRVVIAPSFADIFYSNALKNGILPLVLDEKVVEGIFENEKVSFGKYEIEVDLQKQLVTFPDGNSEGFALDPYRKECLIKEIDDLEYLIENMKNIEEFEKKHAEHIFFNTQVL